MEILSEHPFYQSLPHRPWCSDYATNLTYRPPLVERDRADAILFPFIQINAPGIYRHIAVGIWGRDAFSWEDAQLPQPSLTVLSKTRLDAQLIWTLESPVTTSAKGRRGPQEYAFKVSRAIAERLDGKAVMPRDFRAVAMNPFYPAFQPIWCDATYSLDQLGEVVLGDFRPRRRFAELQRVGNRKRDKALFRIVSLHAYQSVWRFQSEAALAEYLVNFAGVANLSFPRPLGARVVVKKAGDVAAWTWEHRAELVGKNRGAARLVSIPSFVTGKQRAPLRTDHYRAGALYSARVKVRSTVRRIRGAIMRPTLDDEPHDLGISKLSKETGLDRKTIRPHVQHLKQLLKPIDILAIRPRPTVSDYQANSSPPIHTFRVVDGRLERITK